MPNLAQQQLSEPPGLPSPSNRGKAFYRIAYLLLLLFVFLVAIKLLSGGIKMFGADTAKDLFNGVSNPFAALAVGVLATVLVQSSSVTTSTIVAMVGSGTMDVQAAVPMIMGANIGTTITNTLVSIGHVARSGEFRRAFAAATVHDFFNLIMVATFLPLELSTRFLSKTAHWLALRLPLGVGGKYESPIKASVTWGSDLVKHFVTDTLGFQGSFAASSVLLLGVVLVFFALFAITKNMKQLIVNRVEKAMNAALGGIGVTAILIGAVITMMVQSSSITTSLLVPMCGSGILTLENAFPVMLGANIGTTITAFIASLATDINGLEIALVHVLFNLSGTILIFPVARLRAIPIRAARGLAVAAVRNKLWVLAYVGIMFIVVPLVGMLLFK